MFIRVDCDVQLATPGADTLGHSVGSFRSGTGHNFERFTRILSDIEHLVTAAAIAVNRDAFAAFLVGHQINIFYILWGGFGRTIHGFRDSIIRGALKSGLDFDMPFWVDIMGCPE